MRSARFVVSAAALWLVSSGYAHADEPDIRGFAPFVMLVVDSSGSMEDLPACKCNSETDCTNCEPNCTLLNDSNGEPPKNSSGMELKKNRWAVTLEALTGKFNNFECNRIIRNGAVGTAYDEPYTVPYHQPWGCSSGTRCDYPGTTTQQNNGILDSYRDVLRFGLATFDGEYTWRGGGDLENEAKFIANETLNRGMQGMWSEGANKSFHYPGCLDTYQVNSGARSKDATDGALISYVSTNCATPPCDMYSVNDTIQNQLLRTRPYGGTPIAGTLDDLYDHMNTTTDPYATCRKKYAILITDGAPDPDFRNLGCDCGPAILGLTPCSDGSNGDDHFCPYPTAVDAAKKLVSGVSGDSTKPKQIEKLFVLGMSVNDAAAVATLNDIAAAGGTDKALQADDPNTLRSTLDKVFSPLLSPVSRSVPAFAVGLTGVQYQISTGFETSAESLSAAAPPWKGIIERRSFVCDSAGNMTTPSLEDKDRFHLVINKQSTSTRKLQTAAPSTPTVTNVAGALLRGTNSTAHLCGTSYCDLVDLDSSTLPDAVFSNPTSRSALNAWMYGTSSSPRADRRVSDIYHGSPAVVGPPVAQYVDDAYTKFRERAEVKERPLVLYVASNDGVLHAISVEDFPVTGYPLTVHNGKRWTAGEEIWGFVPPMLLPRLKDQMASHQINFDGTPVVKDVFFKRATVAEDTEYHTVLITGLRGGGSGYIALDVTDPIAPKFLWQFIDRDLTQTLAQQNRYDALGLTYGQPEIVQATFKWPADSSGTVQTRAVAILSGGKGRPKTSASTPGCSFNQTQALRRTGSGGVEFASWRTDNPASPNEAKHRGAVRCWEQAGRALYFVDVETGQLIKKIFDNDTDPSNGIYLPSPIVGTPTAYEDALGTVATKGVVMDADGVVWRIDMSATDVVKDDPAKGWTMRPFHDVNWDKQNTDPVATASYVASETSYERPILSLDAKRRLVVIVATGDTDNFEKANADNRIVSLTEVSTKDSPADPEDYQALINWEMRNEGPSSDAFEPSELVTGSMALFEGQLYAASFIPNIGSSNLCDPGIGRLWSLDFVKSDPAHPNTSWNAVGDPKTYGPLRIAVDPSGGADAKLYNVKKSGGQKDLLIQGMSITQRRTCTPPDPDPLNSYFAPTLANLHQDAAPAVWIVAQASSGTKRANSSLGSVESSNLRTNKFSRVTSWATSVD